MEPEFEDPDRGTGRLTLVQWLILFVAAVGFLFDIYELLMMPLIMEPTLSELIGAKRGTPEFNLWKGLLLFLPAVPGGIFGLIGGYLTDRLGRRRVLVGSILLYAFSALAAGFSTSVWMLLFFRSTTFIGVCVEFVAAVAWLAELFPDARRREKVLGATQAFSSVGGLLVAGAFYLANHYALSLPAIHGDHHPWRYTLISGLIPALPLILIRPFLPESPIWKRKRLEGTLQRPSIAALFRPEFRRTTIVTAILFACSYGAAFGAIQIAPQIVPGLPQVRGLTPPEMGKTISGVQTWQEIGGLAGRILLAVLVVRIASRRKLLRVFQIPGLVLIPLVFLIPARTDLELFRWGLFLAGFFTVAQFSFWGNYLPRVYPTHLRGTGESFAANVGGRIVGTSAAMATTTLANFMPGAGDPEKLAYAAAAVAFLVYAVGFIVSFWLPEPAKEELPE